MAKVEKITKFIYLLPILWAVVLRCSIGLFPHSGKDKPIMYGDFEAQRHWMEVTVNLPLKDWYFNTSNNDLNYWGLDYPPLTAYHSYILGTITYYVNSNWTALYESRGSESVALVALMRFFVLITDIVIYLPGLCYYYFILYPKFSHKTMNLETILCGLFFPGIILIDYGHFQYNVASLGLYIISSICLLKDKDIAGSIWFCAALCYKQMELYHSLPIFFLLLGKSLKSKLFVKYFFNLTLTVLLTFLLIFFPIIVYGSGLIGVMQVMHRMFPISRGVFEDKVSNFWCAISVLIKFKSDTQPFIFFICALITLLGSLPACLCVFSNPRKKCKYLYASLIVSLSFFLFSYQVHEKSILIPATSALLLIPIEPFWGPFFLYVATWSMWPLLVKDNLVVATLITTGIYFIFFLKQILSSKRIEKVFFILFNVVFCLILILSVLVKPPPKYPFLYPLLLSQWCCGFFIIHFMYFYWRIFTVTEQF